ncbi:hypothetical protein C8J55DRAFT_552397 [Lentinula edodes]|uniref:Uncharacterized protein n=1 Tax=Lentinula lateritia TaxID=40482 RepID=A0A9W9DEK8_9AGAR|nr:hypothetical protein C8J55DRAFT_552397 [Lentinula edodes]
MAYQRSMEERNGEQLRLFKHGNCGKSTRACGSKIYISVDVIRMIGVANIAKTPGIYRLVFWSILERTSLGTRNLNPNISFAAGKDKIGPIGESERGGGRRESLVLQRRDKLTTAKPAPATAERSKSETPILPRGTRSVGSCVSPAVKVVQGGKR